jgi:hypothetical protein
VTLHTIDFSTHIKSLLKNIKNISNGVRFVAIIQLSEITTSFVMLQIILKNFTFPKVRKSIVLINGVGKLQEIFNRCYDLNIL